MTGTELTSSELGPIQQAIGGLTEAVQGLRRDMQDDRNAAKDDRAEAKEHRTAMRQEVKQLADRTTKLETITTSLAADVASNRKVKDDITRIFDKAKGAGWLGRLLLVALFWLISAASGAAGVLTWLKSLFIHH